MTRKPTGHHEFSKAHSSLRNRSRLEEKRETTEVISQLVDMQRKMKRDKQIDHNNYDSEESENNEEQEGINIDCITSIYFYINSNYMKNNMTIYILI